MSHEPVPQPSLASSRPSIARPAGLGDLVEGAYLVRFARDADDLERVLRLRFEVFNRELGEGLSGSWSTGRDADRFDPHCHHLMLIERASGEAVGTYRLQTEREARAGQGFYCDQEFDLAGLGEATGHGVELGRACIARAHRNGTALYALWRGLAAYLAWSRKRYLFGCCSLTSQDPGEGLTLHRRLEREGHLHSHWRVGVRGAHVCAATSAEASRTAVELPKLFATYLRYGARVCSAPAIDREFRTIDWLVVLDARGLSLRLWRLFFAGILGAPEELEA